MREAEPAGRPQQVLDLASFDRSKVHPQVRAAAEWAWRILLLLAAAYVAGRLFLRFDEVLVPVALAILISAMLVPVVDAMDRRGVPRSLAVLLNIVLGLGLIAAVMAFVVREFMRGLPQLVEEVEQTIEQAKQWLVEGPLDFDQSQVQNVGSDLLKFLQNNQDKVTSGALATATTATEIVTGALLTVFLVIFFLYGGAQIWRFTVGVIPSGSRDRVWRAGIAGFGTLVGYVRATVVVAFVDACGIGVGLAILQVPLALPLGALVFLGAFIPIVGALLSGTLAVFVALITKGWIAAIIALAIVVGVMQLESHVLQPFLLGRSVRLHPVAVVLAITAGMVSAGIIGGLLAVPLIAFLNTAVRHLRGAVPPEETGGKVLGSVDGVGVVEPAEPVWDAPDPDAAAKALATAKEAGEKTGGDTAPGEADDGPDERKGRPRP